MQPYGLVLKKDQGASFRLECTEQSCVMVSSHPLTLNDGKSEISVASVARAVDSIASLPRTLALLQLEFPDHGGIGSLQNKINLFHDLEATGTWYATRGFRREPEALEVLQGGLYEVDLAVDFVSYPSGTSLVLLVNNRETKKSARPLRLACVLELPDAARLQVQLVDNGNAPVPCPVLLSLRIAGVGAAVASAAVQVVGPVREIPDDDLSQVSDVSLLTE